MAIKRPTVSLGPGSLIFGTGTGASLLDISCQVTACKVTFDSDKEDDLPTLCGDTIAGEKIYTSKLEFSAGQDIIADGNLVRDDLFEYTLINSFIMSA